jgi:hypothetical protein
MPSDNIGPTLFKLLRDTFKNLSPLQAEQIERGEAIGAFQFRERGYALLLRDLDQSNDDFRNHPEIANAEIILIDDVKDLIDFAQDCAETADEMMDIVLTVTNDKTSEPQLARIANLIQLSELRFLVDRLEQLDHRMSEIEATLPHPLPSSPQPMSNLDGERQDSA